MIFLLSFLVCYACPIFPCNKKNRKACSNISLWVGSICKLHACAVQALYCADPLIAALLASGAQHYLEFKLVQARYVASA